MKRTYIKSLKEGKVKVSGYIETIRDQKAIQFVVLRDVTGAVQITVLKSDLPEMAEMISKLTTHSFITVEGVCKLAPQVKLGGIEILPTKLIVESIAETLPITSESSQDLRLDFRWIDLRDEKKVFMFKVLTDFEKFAYDWLTKREYIEIHTPKITGLSSEGGSEVFYLKDYFGQKACLTQSPQLYKQMSIMAGFDKTFEIGNYYRANPSFTSRHDTEFYGLDLEIAHIKSVEDVMKVEEELLKYIFKKIEQKYKLEMKKYFPEVAFPTFGEKQFPRISLLKVYEILKEEMGYEVSRELKGDLDPEGERLICKYVKEKFDSDFVFITDFPIKARAFYTKKKEHAPELGECYDLLFKGLEITSGAQREHRYSELKERIRESGIKPETMQQYLEFFKYGAPTHGGFGLSPTRVFMKYFELASVKECTFLFRGPNRLLP